MGRTISHQQQAANFRSHQLPLARGVRAYRFRLHSHSGRGEKDACGIQLVTPGLCSETSLIQVLMCVGQGLASWSQCPLLLWASGQ